MVRYKNSIYTISLIIFMLFISSDKIYGEEKIIDRSNVKYKIIEDDKSKDYGSVEVIGESSQSHENVISIPEIIDLEGRKYHVVRIGERAFKNCKIIKMINIPHTIVTIGRDAFNEAENLEIVYIEDRSRLFKIEENAFYDCRKLKTINIPDNVEEIEQNSFYNCKCLEDIKLPKGLKVLNKNVFSGCSSLKKIDVTNVETIEMSVFKDCTELEHITMSERLKYIGDGAFFNCINLKEINIPNSVNEIGTAAFSECRNMIKVNIPISINELKDSVFKGCLNLREIEIPENLKVIYTEAFFNCINLNKIVFKGDSPPYIDKEAFNGCSNITINTLKNEEEYKKKLKEFKIFNIRYLKNEFEDTNLKEEFTKKSYKKETKSHRIKTHKTKRYHKEESDDNLLIELYKINLLNKNMAEKILVPYGLSLAVSMKSINTYR